MQKVKRLREGNAAVLKKFPVESEEGGNGAGGGIFLF